MRGHQVQLQPANVIQEPNPDHETPYPAIPEELKDGHGDDMVPESNQGQMGTVAGHDRRRLPAGRVAPVHRLGGERPRSHHGQQGQEQLRPLDSRHRANVRWLLKGGIILRPHHTGPHEMQPRGRDARPNGHLGDENERHGDQETGEGGKVQQ